MPYLAEEFTEIWWRVVVFQQRGDCLEDNEPNVSLNLQESHRGCVSAQEGGLVMEGAPPCHPLGKKAHSLIYRPGLLNLWAHGSL